jgi:hypothetical protein
VPGPGSLDRFASRVRASIGRRRGGDGAGVAPADVDRSGTDGVEVRYAPELDGEPDPGEVVWAWVPFEEDPTQGKDRPVLVIGFEGPELAAVQLSSKDHSGRRDAEDWIAVGRGPWDPEMRVSYADAARLLRLDPTAVRREGAALERGRFDQVLARVRMLHGWVG